jgi:Tol biopolymer transport system component
MKGNILSQLTNEAGYDAEATVSPKGDKIVFTSMRTGDLELFTMNIDGTGVKQITTELGYDGGAFFSPDGTKLVWRASRPQTPEAIQEYKDLLKEGLVKPTDMELYVSNVDGTDIRKITSLGKANWAPFFHPSGKKLIFASNHQTQRGYPALRMMGLSMPSLCFPTMESTSSLPPIATMAVRVTRTCSWLSGLGIDLKTLQFFDMC